MATPAISLKHVSFSYSSLATRPALKDINLTINKGSIVSIVGHTGSGKSTMVSLIDGLITPRKGEITVEDVTIDPNSKAPQLTKLRQHVGYVFQFPEQQLFAETVAQDVAFGPTNLGWSSDQVKQAVDQALMMVGLNAELKSRSPFTLSGGQKRRVALAGVLAMKPAILILDEPTAGLDAVSTARLLNNIRQLNRQGTTILLITHQMDQVAALADQVVVMNHGKLVKSAAPKAIFSDIEFLHENHLLLPDSVAFANELRKQGVEIALPLTMDQLADQLAQRLGGKTDHE